MSLKRDINAMPPDIAEALAARRLRERYDERPDYQRNDYLGWIARAAQPETRRKRMAQMLDELERGGIYMNMTWKGPR